ncbi:MAG TPA: CHC2 zinc finger domain-containing protein, partial [Planctomycetota bacterium]|nr:CHC2 zinc finger domain-containing protein [Planctomycetota bacterium]
MKAATDLVELIGAFFPLRRAGSSYWALCPFHEEKSPSFHVLADRQIFKCFGCGEAGDAITFVEKREGLSFREALEWLAARAGVTLSERSSGNTLRNRDGVLGCLEEATRHFERLLAGPGTGAADARRYLDERGLPETLRREWRIGLAPAGRQALSGALASRGCTPDALASAGLVGRSDDGRT